MSWWAPCCPQDTCLETPCMRPYTWAYVHDDNRLATKVYSLMFATSFPFTFSPFYNEFTTSSPSSVNLSLLAAHIGRPSSHRSINSNAIWQKYSPDCRPVTGNPVVLPEAQPPPPLLPMCWALTMLHLNWTYMRKYYRYYLLRWTGWRSWRRSLMSRSSNRRQSSTRYGIR